MRIDHRAGVLLALVGAALSCGAASAGELDRIRETKTLVLAHRESSFPFSYVGPDGKPIGYAMDLCNKLADAVKAQLKMPDLAVKPLLVTPASRIPAIVEKKASMECGSTTNNADRRKQVNFTIAHFISSSRFLVKANSGIKGIEDLSKKPVISTKGTTPLAKLQRLNNEQGLGLNILEAVDHAEAFRAVESGKAVAFAMDDVLLYGLRANAKNPADFIVVGKPMTIEPYAIMLPKDEPEFKALIDKEMRRLIYSGEAAALYRKWFEQPVPPKGVNMQTPMSGLLRDSFKFPSDKVGELD